MRKLVFPLLIFFIACNNKNDQPEKKIENPDHLISMYGIGPIKTDTYQEELEKIIGKKIPLTNPQDTISGSWMDSAFIRFKEADMRLTFQRAYDADNNFTMRMTAIQTSSPLCKTSGGIGIGSSKMDIVHAFPDNFLSMNYGYENDTDTIPSKSKYIITVRDLREGPQIIFFLRNNRVYSIEVGSYYDDEE